MSFMLKFGGLSGQYRRKFDRQINSCKTNLTLDTKDVDQSHDNLLLQYLYYYNNNASHLREQIYYCVCTNCILEGMYN